MLKSVYVLLAVMTLLTKTVARRTNSDVKLISAKPTEQVRFDCRKRSEDEVLLWRIITKTGSKVERKKCADAGEDPIDVRKKCVDERYGYDLIITRINDDDEGIYECTAAIQKEVLEVYDLRIEREAFIPETAYSKDVTIREGGTAKLWCNASGYPVPNIKWQIVELDSNGRESVQDIGIQGKLLNIQNVSRHCDNWYRCVASNELSRNEASQNIRIRVNFGAMADFDVYSDDRDDQCGDTVDDLGEKLGVNTSRSYYIEKKQGVRLSLVCSGSGSPNATIEWFRYQGGNRIKISTLGLGNQIVDTKQIGSFVSAICPSLFQDERRFKISFVVLDDKFTKYVCRASNEYGVDEMTITIKKRP
ncbi:neuronal growth regulator 1-like [Argopecten irradians]|uniref:neuronal growth regulator 1-like n=1 Tax=Argopecten irradians TaxID=31199 RepID=UPI0037103BF4